MVQICGRNGTWVKNDTLRTLCYLLVRLVASEWTGNINIKWLQTSAHNLGWTSYGRNLCRCITKRENVCDCRATSLNSRGVNFPDDGAMLYTSSRLFPDKVRLEKGEHGILKNIAETKTVVKKEIALWRNDVEFLYTRVPGRHLSVAGERREGRLTKLSIHQLKDVYCAVLCELTKKEEQRNIGIPSTVTNTYMVPLEAGLGNER